MASQIKKVLVVSAYAPPSVSGSGLMMYNLLNFFPAENLAILTSEEDTNPDIQRYKLNCPYYYYGSKILSLKFNERDDSWQQKIKRQLKNNTAAKFFAQFVLLFSVPRKIVAIGRQAIEKENIDFLLGYSDWGLNLFGVYLLHKKTGKPFNLHFFDLYQANKMPWLFRLLSKWLEPRLFRSATKISVMCEELQQYYQKKYHRPIEVVHNAIVFNPANPSVLPSKKIKNNKFQIIFLGSIYWAQEQAVKNLVSAVNAINDFSVELVLYTPHSEQYLNAIGIESNNKIRFSFCLPDQALKVLSAGDLLFLGLSFSSGYEALINTSSPGRLCDYLISGTPILAHADKNSFLSKYIIEYKSGYVVSENSVSALVKAIKDSIGNEAEANFFAKNAFALAIKNHQAILESKKLLAILN